MVKSIANTGIILGVDLSLTSTGVCELIPDRVDPCSYLIKPRVKGCERLTYIEKRISSVINAYHPRLVILEGYSFGSRTGQAFSIGELGGIIKVLLFNSKFKTILVPPTCLKKFVTGKGNSGKEVMLMKTLSKYNREFTDNNLCDAFGLAMMGKAYLNGTDIQYEKEALKKVEILK